MQLQVAIPVPVVAPVPEPTALWLTRLYCHNNIIVRFLYDFSIIRIKFVGAVVITVV